MDRRQRMTLLGVAAVIAVAAVVIALVASGGDDKKSNSTTAAQTQPQSQDTSGEQPLGTTTETTPPPAAGTTAGIQIQGGQPVGGVQKIDAKKGDPLQILVSSDEKLPIHFHGYDIEKDAAPGKPAVFELKDANIDGVFEMEIESTKTKIASITVKP
jgi:hypothetical protein